ncbi:MAG: hypothetical protein JWM59_1862 [Verrucomicrobiales bacterium]|nr:hypothetical protein [Verrucomicrobiales bacterium]
MNQNQNTQDPAGSRGPTSPLALAKSHFDHAAKAPDFAEAARNPTPSQQTAAKHGETGTSIAARQWQQIARKSSEELAAEARRYAPGGHRACLLAAAHFREQEEMAEGKVPAPSAPESAAVQAERYEPGAHRGLLLMAAHREEQQQAAPTPAAITEEACPWTRLVNRMKREGYTAENRVEHERLKAIDAAAKAPAAAAPSAAAALPPGPFQQRWEAMKAKGLATPASVIAAAPGVQSVASSSKSQFDWTESIRRAVKMQRAAGASF